MWDGVISCRFLLHITGESAAVRFGSRTPVELKAESPNRQELRSKSASRSRNSNTQSCSIAARRLQTTRRIVRRSSVENAPAQRSRNTATQKRYLKNKTPGRRVGPPPDKDLFVPPPPTTRKKNLKQATAFPPNPERPVQNHSARDSRMWATFPHVAAGVPVSRHVRQRSQTNPSAMATQERTLLAVLQHKRGRKGGSGPLNKQDPQRDSAWSHVAGACLFGGICDILIFRPNFFH
jgi:hypothetical protein